MRSFEKLVDLQKEFIFEPNQTDIFVCANLEKEPKDRILHCYGDYLKDIVHYPGSRNLGHKGIHERYEKAKCCHDLMRKHEEAEGKYDVVIFMRPDMSLESPIVLSDFEILDDVIYVFSGVSSKYKIGSLWDGFAISSSEGMDSLASLAEDYGTYRTKESKTVYSSKHGESPEAQLMMHLHYNNMRVRPIGKDHKYFILRDGSTTKKKDKPGFKWKPKKKWDKHPEEIESARHLILKTQVPFV